MLNIISENAVSGKYECCVTGLTRMDLKRDMTLMWTHLLKYVSVHHEHSSWNRIIFEIWIERGFVLAYCQKKGKSLDPRLFEVTIVVDYIPEMLKLLNEQSTDEQFEGLRAIAYIDTRESIRESYRKEPAISSIQAALKNNDFKCYTMQSADINTMMEFGIFF